MGCNVCGWWEEPDIDSPGNWHIAFDLSFLLSLATNAGCLSESRAYIGAHSTRNCRLAWFERPIAGLAGLYTSKITALQLKIESVSSRIEIAADWVQEDR